MNWIDVISVGPGDEKQLTLAAREAIAQAEAVFCAPRHAGLVPPEKRRSLTPFAAALDAMEKEKNAAVLVSGDAGLYSMLGLLSRRFGRQRLRVVAGVSSLQAFCARLALPWQEAKILSLHGRDCGAEALCHYARTNRQVLLLLDETRDPHWVRQALVAGGLEDSSLIVGERVSYPDERIAPYSQRDYDALCVALITNDHPQCGLPPLGLNDDAFLRGKTPMTKREVRVQALAALRLTPDATVWDVGAGTGSVSIEAARQCPLGTVYAIERDDAALNLIQDNVAHFKLQNVQVISGSAPAALAGLPTPTHVFLGCTGGETASILALLQSLGTPIRLCATAVTMESAAALTQLFSQYADFQASQIAVSRLEAIGSYHMIKAQNPVTVFSAMINPERCA